MNPPPSSSTRKVGLMTCVFLVIATMVGSGLYTNLGVQLTFVSSSFTILTLWALGGLVALSGALSYAELAAQMPHSGGEYYYLSKVYHPALGTMAGIITQMAGCIGPIALASMAFGTYSHTLFPSLHPTITAFFLVTFITGVHLFNIGVSAFFQDITTGIKFFLLVLLFYVGCRYTTIPLQTLLPSKQALGELFHPSAGVVLIFCFYAYSGWNASTYIADDVVASEKTISRSLIFGSLSVIFIYLLMNALFLLSAPMNQLRGVLDVGSVVALYLLGERGGHLMSALIALGLIASISAMTWTGPHIMQSMAKNLAALRWFAPASWNKVPVRAILFQYALVVLLLILSSFKTILLSTQFALIFCELLAVFSVILLRHPRASAIASPKNAPKNRFRSPLYPLPQLFFIVVSTMALLYTMVTNFFEAFLGIIFILSALASYPLLCRGEKTTKEKSR